MSKPEVSVLISLYNAGPSLGTTLDSILSQQGCDFEIVAVNDGSTDGTGGTLDAYAARDPRVRVLHQANTGLTRALINGGRHARGDYIARHDAEDVSLPGRLQAQCGFLAANPDTAAVSSGVRIVAPHGEWMHDYLPEAVVQPDIGGDEVQLPPLIGTMFRRDAYEKAGGFRAEFVVAQDIDLWLRLLEQGRCAGLQQVHYQSVATQGGITSLRRAEQVRMTALALACARRRREGGSDADLLAAYVPGPRGRPARKASAADFSYFIGSCLRGHNPEAARRYFGQALRDNPLHFKSWVRRLFG